MKRIVLIALVAMVLSVNAVASAHEIEKPVRFGLGPTLGVYGLGLSTNTFVLEEMSVQVNVTPIWVVFGVTASADFLFWLHEIANHEAFDFTWYAGPGVGIYHLDMKTWGKGTTGFVQATIGLAMQFKDVPMDLTFQVTPGIQFGNFGDRKVWFWGSAGFATRYYF